MYGAGANFFTRSQNRTKLVGAGVGSVTLDFRSRKCPKKWRLRNTGLGTYIFYLISWFLSIDDYCI